jgi:hypothetical protein
MQERDQQQQGPSAAVGQNDLQDRVRSRQRLQAAHTAKVMAPAPGEDVFPGAEEDQVRACVVNHLPTVVGPTSCTLNGWWRQLLPPNQVDSTLQCCLAPPQLLNSPTSKQEGAVPCGSVSRDLTPSSSLDCIRTGVIRESAPVDNSARHYPDEVQSWQAGWSQLLCAALQYTWEATWLQGRQEQVPCCVCALFMEHKAPVS